jgi:hypothetical protein
MTSNASANDLKAALISPGTGTACGRVLLSAGLGVISFSAAKKEDKSGRRLRRPLLSRLVGVVECSTVIYDVRGGHLAIQQIGILKGRWGTVAGNVYSSTTPHVERAGGGCTYLHTKP